MSAHTGDVGHPAEAPQLNEGSSGLERAPRAVVYVGSVFYGVIAVPCTKVTAKTATPTSTFKTLGHSSRLQVGASPNYGRTLPGFHVTPEAAASQVMAALQLRYVAAQDAYDAAKRALNLAEEHYCRIARGEQVAVRAVEDCESTWLDEDGMPGPIADGTISLAQEGT